MHGLNSALNAGSPLTARYAWNFGEPGSLYNNLVGFNAGHVYDTPGDYTITLTLTNGPGNVDTAQTTIRVSTPGRRIYYVSNSGNDSNSGADPSNAIKSIAKVKSILGGGNDNLEFRFNDGDTFNIERGNRSRRKQRGLQRLRLGTAPVLYWVGVKDYVAMIWASGTSDRVTVQNLTLQTKFTGADKTNMPDAIKASGDNLVVRNNIFMDVGYAVNCNGKPDGVIVEKNISPTQTSLRSSFVWVAGNDHVILGNKVANSTREAVHPCRRRQSHSHRIQFIHQQHRR